MEGIEISDQSKESIRTLGENENNIYLEILEADQIKQTEMRKSERKDKKGVPRKNEKTS